PLRAHPCPASPEPPAPNLAQAVICLKATSDTPTAVIASDRRERSNPAPFACRPGSRRLRLLAMTAEAVALRPRVPLQPDSVQRAKELGVTADQARGVAAARDGGAGLFNHGEPPRASWGGCRRTPPAASVITSPPSPRRSRGF